jgi:hypothetical protein
MNAFESRFKITLMLAMVLLILGGCSRVTQSTNGIDVRNPRFSPDGKSIIFDRCDSDSPAPDKCRIQVYNTETGLLGYYLPSPGRVWMMAHYADTGDKLVFVTSPAEGHTVDLSTRRETYLNYQIATMNLDGSNMHVVTKDRGLKIFPAFSHSGNKVIFAQSEKIRDSGKTVAAYWDLWELDLKTSAVTLFAGKFEFFQMGHSVYFPDDQRVLLNGDVPMSKELVGPSGTLAKSYQDYARRYNNSYVFVVKRGQTILDSPLFTDLSWVGQSSMDAQGNMCFTAGGGPKEGTRIRRVGLDGSRQSWAYPPQNSDQSTILGTDVSKDGRYLVLALSDGPMLSKNRKIMLLDTVSGTWREVVLPHEAKQIN